MKLQISHIRFLPAGRQGQICTHWKLELFAAQAGVTLIELLLVMAIFSLIGLLSIPFYSRFLVQNTVQNTQDQLVNSLRKAQLYSMVGKQNGTWGVRYTESPQKITLYVENNAAFDESFSIAGGIAIAGLSDITFARITGIPSSSPTITITGSGNTTKTVTVTSQGIVQKPN